jgi:DNA polymerase (family 10)
MPAKIAFHPTRSAADAAMSNLDIASAFEEIADMLEIEGANPFRIRAYRNAARTLIGLKEEVGALVGGGTDLSDLPGIGNDLAGKIADLAATGHTELLDRLHKELPRGLPELLRVPALGPKRVALLHRRLRVKDVAGLKAAVASGKLKSLPGFGPKIEASIKAALVAQGAVARRFTLAEAGAEAEPLLDYLRDVPGVRRAEAAGSYRRGRDTVGDLDIVASASQESPVIRSFTRYPRAERVIAEGATRSAIVLRSGMQVDLRVVAEKEYGAALYYLTGSKAHNIAIRRIGVEHGLKINEYGIFRGAARIAGETEGSVPASIGLPLIPPELREDRGEIAAARAGKLPRLIELADLRGDLHCHTTASDGRNSLSEMAAAARSRGFKYVAITEHSRRLAMARGFDARRLARQGEEIDRFNATSRDVTLLKGIEVDILEDGTLDLPSSALAPLDLVVGAVHSHFNLAPERQTARLLRAIDSKQFTILAHPAGRLLGQREAIGFDMARVMEAARARGCFLELNAQPVRLDLDDVHCRAAREGGVRIAISSDAHSVAGFDDLHYGILQARRGWIERNDVPNALGLKELRPLLARTMR